MRNMPSAEAAILGSCLLIFYPYQKAIPTTLAPFFERKSFDGVGIFRHVIKTRWKAPKIEAAHEALSQKEKASLAGDLNLV